MSLTLEEIQKTLTESMKSMQDSMDKERKGFKSKIESLEAIIRDKENLINNLTKKKSKDLIIKNLEQENEQLKRNYEMKDMECKKIVMESNSFNKQIEIFTLSDFTTFELPSKSGELVYYKGVKDSTMKFAFYLSNEEKIIHFKFSGPDGKALLKYIKLFKIKIIYIMSIRWYTLVNIFFIWIMEKIRILMRFHLL